MKKTKKKQLNIERSEEGGSASAEGNFADEDGRRRVFVGLAGREDAAESGAEARIQEMIEQRIDAAVGAAHPLRNGHHDPPEALLGLAHVFSGEFQPTEGDVEREPGQGEGYDHGGQHAQGADLGLLQPVRDVDSVCGGGDDLAGDLTVPDAPADERVAADDDHQRRYVAQAEVGHHEVGLAHRRIAPLFCAHHLFRRALSFFIFLSTLIMDIDIHFFFFYLKIERF